LNAFEATAGRVVVTTLPEDRFEAVQKYLRALFEALKGIEASQEELLLGKLGSGAETIWLRSFQNFVNHRFANYHPEELVDWMERQDKAIQDHGRELGTKIERHLKSYIITNLKAVFAENWDIEIGQIQRDCENRAKEQMEKNYKEGLGRQEIPWTDQFFITDYKKIIEKYWGKAPDDAADDFVTFEKHFAIDIDQGFNSKAEKLKWLSMFSSLRNLWAHEGSKEKGLNQHETDFLQRIHDHFEL
jgi:hypothetical protein